MIRTLARLLTYACLALLIWASPAAAGPIAPILAALGTAFKAAVTVKALAATALRLLISTGVSLLMKKYQQRKQRQPGLQTAHTSTGGTDPQATIAGRYATAGHLVYHNSHGPNNIYLTHVIEVGDLPGATLRRLIIDGEYSEIGAELHPNPDLGYPILSKSLDEGPYGWIRFLDGSQLEADARLVALYGDDADRPWTNNHILTGVCYAVLTFHRKDSLYPQGRPQYRFELDGPGFYDLRQDSTVGGTGTQRWADPTTWAQTGNVMVIAYNIMRGITLPCGTIYGGAVEAEDLPVSEWVAAMDACDQATGPNNRPQFRGGYEIRFEEAPADILQELFSSANAEIVEVGGYWYPLVGADAVAVADIEVDQGDVLVSESWQHEPFPGVENTFNAITISHPSPGALWNSSTLETIVMDDWVAEDGGQKLFDLRLPMVWNAAQARQLARALLKENRQFRTHRWPLPPDFFHLRPLQTINATSAEYGYDGKSFRITEVAYDLLRLNVSLSVRETDPSDFDPDAALELPEVAPPTGAVAAPDAGVPGFAVVGARVKDANGVDRAPAIRITWDSELEDSARAVTFEAKVSGAAGELLTASTSDVGSGAFILTPVVPAASYLVRAKALARKRRTDWTLWLPVTSPDVGIPPEALAEATYEAIGNDAASIASSLDADVIAERIEPIDAAVANLNRDLQLQAVDQRSAAEALAVIGDQVLWAISRISDVDGRMADAGIVVDPDTGTVRIYALEQEAERISETEIRLNAAEANIALSATESYVDRRVSEAITDPTQIPLLDNLQVQVNQVTLDLDAVEAALELKASQTVVDGLSVGLTEAVADIDALNEAITFKVDQASFDDYASRLETAEVQISTLDGPQISQTVADSRALQDAADLADLATLGALLQAYEDREAARQDLAYATQDLHARVDDEREARAAVTFSLGAAIDNNMALIEAERKVRASETAAIASDVVQLDARLASAEGNISGQATAITSLTTQVTDTETGLVTLSQDLVDLSARVTTAEGNVEGNAGAVQALDARVTDAEGDISAQATSLTSLSTTVGQNSSSISQALTSIDGISAEYTLRIDNNGVVYGMVLRSDLDDNNVPTGEVAFVADKFAIVAPDGTKRKSPFVVYTEDTVVGGVFVPAGVYMRRVAIRDGFITRAMLANAIIGSAQIGEAEIDTLHLAGQAVTVPVSSWAAADVLLSPSWAVLNTLTIDRAVGVSTKIDVSFHHTGNSEVASLQFQLQRKIGTGSWSTLRSVDLGFAGTYGRLEAFTHVDENVAGGSTQYRLRAIQVGSLGPGNTSAAARQVSIYATQFKR